MFSPLGACRITVTAGITNAYPLDSYVKWKTFPHRKVFWPGVTGWKELRWAPVIISLPANIFDRRTELSGALQM